MNTERIKERNEIAKAIYLKNTILTESVAYNAVQAANDMMAQMYGENWDCEPSGTTVVSERGKIIEQVIVQDGAPDCISTHIDENGGKWVRVKMLDEDFLIADRDYTEGDTNEFKWQDAMDAMAKIGRSMWTKKQMHIVAAFIDKINAKLKEIGGEVLDGFYWSSTEYSSRLAWYVYFSSGYIYFNSKYGSFYVRPCAAFNN